MIHLDAGATMECEFEKGCDARLAVKLALTMGGGFAARPPSGHGWQFGVNKETGVLAARCPKHHVLINQPDTSLRISTH